MSQNTVGGKGIKVLKAFIFALLVFMILVAVFGALIRYTPLPERWTLYYMLLSLCISCFFIGMYAGNMFKKRGILFGALFAVLFILLTVVIGVLVSGVYSEAGLLQARYIICVVCGSLGGMLGVNMR